VSDVWVIANPVAGGGRGSRHAARITKALHDAGIPSRLVHPASAHATAQAAGEAVRAGARAVLAAGGDGTVHAVLQPLVGTDTPLGIIAGGSGDDIAASLGFPTKDVTAITTALVRAVAVGRTSLIDVGHVITHDGADRYFLGVMSTGFDSAVNERANTMARLGGQRYNVAIVRELASFRPVPYEVVIDGELIRADGMLVSVGNGPRYGGGMLVCPAARMDDGLLDITWLGAVSTLTFLRALPLVFKGTHVTKSYVRTHRGREFTISAPGQIAYADGERIGPLPISVRAIPGALRVLSS
jgi:diacylglycerol kinase (ATP)